MLQNWALFRVYVNDCHYDRISGRAFLCIKDQPWTFGIITVFTGPFPNAFSDSDYSFQFACPQTGIHAACKLVEMSYGTI